MPDQPLPVVVRYPLAVLACAAVVAVAGALLVGAGWLIFDRLGDFIDRQVWLVRLALQCAAGLTLLVILGGGIEFTKLTWNHITGTFDEPDADGRKHGRHAKWRPGYDPNDEPPPAGGGAHGPCPKCGFTFQWDGTTCGHCKYTRPA
ncbi:MAG: hypothetical protein FJ304_25845 [Planctomycetes bacterium]|nr:hypothetical protein [Planctomycetota bacterium]